MKTITFILILFFIFAKAGLAQETFSPEDKEILEEGIIDQRTYVTGGVVGSLVGFGTGHAVIGKYKQVGWLYTAAEAGFLGLMIVGHKKSVDETLRDGVSGDFDGSNYGLMIVGYVGFISSKIGEIFDIWNRPHEHNRRHQELLDRKQETKAFLLPTLNKQGAPGLSLVYQF